jgi:hypothetical protein
MGRTTRKRDEPVDAFAAFVSRQAGPTRDDVIAAGRLAWKRWKLMNDVNGLPAANQPMQ